MITNKLMGLAALVLVLAGINANAQEVVKLAPNEFEQKLKAASDGQLVDVRTPEEFKDKHLKDAMNMNYKDDEFQTQLASLDKNKPVFVYCLAGPRSTAAAAIMKEKGFKEIYELDGGITGWIGNKKPIVKAKKEKAEGMSLKALNEYTKGNKLVIVDFNAVWCGPCRKMKPFLDKAAKEKADVVTILPVDADISQELVEHYRIEALPTLLLFKNSKQLLRHEGFLDQSGIDQLIEKYK